MTKEQEKNKMIKEWKYYAKDTFVGREIVALMRVTDRGIACDLPGIAGSFVLSYLKNVHGVCLLPERDKNGNLIN